MAIVPVVLLSGDERQRRRHWGFIRQDWPTRPWQARSMALRDLQALKNTPVAVTSVCASSGRVLSQNTASMALMGTRASSQGGRDVHRQGGARRSGV